MWQLFFLQVFKLMPGPTRRPVTAHDVASLAGVSQSAVSRTYTKGASVAPKTRGKVEAAAAALGYRPNLLARSLITRRSGQIGVIVPSLANPFYAQVLEELARAFEALDYQILLFSTASQEDSDPVLEEVLRRRVDGLVLVSSSLSSRFADECQKIGLPVVLLNRKNNSEVVSSVTSDNAGGGEAIADFLIASGHKALAFLAGNERSSTSRDREKSFIRRLQLLGSNQPLREVGNYTFQEAMTATHRLLRRDSTRPDGIFCANDFMAIAALNVVREIGMEPGRDISIVGFDNIPMSAWPSISLTTYLQPIEWLVREAVEVIQAQLQNSTFQPIQKILPGHLILRKSTRSV